MASHLCLHGCLHIYVYVRILDSGCDFAKPLWPMRCGLLIVLGCFHTTGRAGWGIAWYINGTLIPELIVERNKTYTFIVEGGTDPNALSNYHPLYITDSIGGGRLQNTQQERDVSPIKHCYCVYISISITVLLLYLPY